MEIIINKKSELVLLYAIKNQMLSALQKHMICQGRIPPEVLADYIYNECFFALLGLTLTNLVYFNIGGQAFKNAYR